MIIVDTQAEARLQNHLQILAAQEDKWCILHLHLQAYPQVSASDITASLVSLIEAQESYVYLSEAGDAFVLARGVSPRMVRRAALSLHAQGKSQLLDPLSDYYDPHGGWHRLLFLLEGRLNAQRERERQLQLRARQQAAAQARQAILNMPLDANLVSTLGERRQRHAQPVVLVVEDEPFSGRLVESVLEGHYPISLVGDGQSALLSYVRLAPHVLFLDIDLPDISGHDVLARLLAIDPQAYIVMLSGNCDRRHIEQAVTAGAAGFVGKPFTRSKLCQYIARCPALINQRSGG